MRVVQLLPGQIFDGNTYIGQFPHPFDAKKQMVIWSSPAGGIKFEEESPGQELGEPDTEQDVRDRMHYFMQATAP